MGPVDGHDVRQLESVIRWAREMRRPVLVHVLTRKGKGCTYAEEHPELYHGVGPFDPESGALKSSSTTFSEVFGKSLCEFGVRDERIVGITAAMASGTGLDRFAEEFPSRFVDAGIAEGHATALAAGMASQGALPVFAVYSSFLQRGYDMLIHDVSLQKLHIVFGVDRAGIVGSDGETHHGLFDLAYLHSVPGMQILCPASFRELHDQLEIALFRLDGPVAIRYPRGGEGVYRDSCTEDEQVIRPGSDLTLVCCGTMVNEALEAAKIMERGGISAEIVKINRIGNEPYSLTLESLRKTGRLLAAEEICAADCLGQQLAAQAAQGGISLRAVRMLNLGDGIVVHGTREQLMRDWRIDAASIADAAAKLCADKAEEA